MKDRIVEGYLKDFAEKHALPASDEAKAFEHFINYCVISREHPENFDFEDVSIGGGGDYGIDGIAILVNDHLVTSVEEVDFFKKTLRRLDARFLFIQSKTSDKFDSGDIGNFLFGVRTFFNTAAPVAANPQIERLRKLSDHIYNSSIDMDRPPACQLFYASLGVWKDDPVLQERIAAELAYLRQTNLFSDVSFTPMDAEQIKNLYRELRRKLIREITFDKHTILPAIKDVQEAYIGILPATEYLKLISDADSKLQRASFYDNVRDFQGHNPVNREIQRTLENGEEKDKFLLLNNGITVVAESIGKVGSKFTLRDFQIVNGCQTSHVLFRNQNQLDGVYVPIKLIVTGDAEVKSLITKGTNRQTEVKVEAFESLRPFQKELEEFYSTYGKDRSIRLYYERRSRQYDSLPIPEDDIVTLSAQIKCFVAMFLNDPHSTHRYYGELLDAYRSRLFVGNHSPFPYYLSAYAFRVMNALFGKGRLENVPKRFKYHVLMLFRMLVEQTAPPYLNDKRKMDAYCSELMKVLADEESAHRVFARCASIIRTALAKPDYREREADRLRAFTAEITLIAESSPHPATASVERKLGRIKAFTTVRGFGFISVDDSDQEAFVHISSVRTPGIRALSQGQRVEFTLEQTPKGLAAEDVEILL